MSTPLTPEESARFADLSMHLALRGFQLRAVEAGGFFVSRQDGACFCSRLEDVEIFARKSGCIE